MKQTETVDIEERGLPKALEQERLVLGSLMLQGPDLYSRLAPLLTEAEFSTEAHRRIFRVMGELDKIGSGIDRASVAEALMVGNQIESVGGFAYLIDLDEGMPKLPDLSGYVNTLRRKSSLRKIITVSQESINMALLGELPEMIIGRAESTLNGIAYGQQEGNPWKTPGQVMTEAKGGFEGFLNPHRGGGGIQTPWDTLNEMVCGFQSGDLVLFAGRPSHGKSAAAVQIARRAAGNGTGVAVVSLEMSNESLIRRMLCTDSRIDSNKMRNGWLSTEERDRIRLAANTVADLPIYLNEKGGMTTIAIRSALKSLMATHPIGLVIIDHFHLVEGIGRQETREKYNDIADGFQRMAKELAVPFVVLVQLSRKCEEDNRAPGMSDLKETGKLEENADIVVATYRPEMYAKNRHRQDLRGMAEFIVLKQRNGPTGTIPMVFLSNVQKFEQQATDQEKE